jgi:hypothetical protein
MKTKPHPRVWLFYTNTKLRIMTRKEEIEACYNKLTADLRSTVIRFDNTSKVGDTKGLLPKVKEHIESIDKYVDEYNSIL